MIRRFILIFKHINFNNKSIIFLSSFIFISLIGLSGFLPLIQTENEKGLYSELPQPDLITEFTLEKSSFNPFLQNKLTNFTNNQGWRNYVDYLFNIDNLFQGIRKLKNFLIFDIDAFPFYRDSTSQLLVNYAGSNKAFDTHIFFVLLTDEDFSNFENQFIENNTQNAVNMLFFYKSTFPYHLGNNSELNILDQENNNLTLKANSSISVIQTEELKRYLDFNYNRFPYTMAKDYQIPALITSISNFFQVVNLNSILINNIYFESHFWFEFNEMFGYQDLKDPDSGEEISRVLETKVMEYLSDKDLYIPDLQIHQVRMESSSLILFNEKLSLIAGFRRITDVLLPAMWITTLLIGFYTFLYAHYYFLQSKNWNSIEEFYSLNAIPTSKLHFDCIIILIILSSFGLLCSLTFLNIILPNIINGFSFIVMLIVPLASSVIYLAKKMVFEINFKRNQVNAFFNKNVPQSQNIIFLIIIFLSTFFLLNCYRLINWFQDLEKFIYLHSQANYVLIFLFFLIPLLICFFFVKNFQKVIFISLMFINQLLKNVKKMKSIYYFFLSYSRKFIFTKPFNIIILLLLSTILSFSFTIVDQEHFLFYNDSRSIGADAKLQFSLFTEESIVSGTNEISKICESICNSLQSIEIIPYKWIYSTMKINTLNSNTSIEYSSDLFASGILLTEIDKLNKFKYFNTFTTGNTNTSTPEISGYISELLLSRIFSENHPNLGSRIQLSTETIFTPPQTIDFTYMGSYVHPPSITKEKFISDTSESLYSVILDYNKINPFLLNNTLQFTKEVESGFYLWFNNFSLANIKSFSEEVFKAGYFLEISPTIIQELQGADKIVFGFFTKFINSFIAILLITYAFIQYLDIKKNIDSNFPILASLKYQGEKSFSIFSKFFMLYMFIQIIHFIFAYLIAFIVSTSFFIFFTINFSDVEFWKLNYEIYNSRIISLVFIFLIIVILELILVKRNLNIKLKDYDFGGGDNYVY
jgi:hypothetical protein